MPTFKQELAILINRFSIENKVDTPDFILAEYLNDCLESYEKMIKKKEKWYCNKNI